MTDILHTIDSSASPDRAYAAAATEDGIKGWWTDRASVPPQEGGKVHLQFDKAGTIVDMYFVVEVLEPNKRVLWRCTENVNPVWPGTTIEWAIEASDAGSRLTLTHGGFEEDQSPPYQMTVQGWPMFVERLQAYLS